MEYSVVIQLASDIVSNALPVGIIFLLVDKIVGLFIRSVFGKWGVS